MQVIGTPLAPVMGGMAGPDSPTQACPPTKLCKHCRNLWADQRYGPVPLKRLFTRAHEQPQLPHAQGAGDLRAAKSRLGLGYEPLPDGGTSLLGGGAAAAQLAKVEAYFSPAIAALY